MATVDISGKAPVAARPATGAARPARRSRRVRLGPGRPIPFGFALGPALLVLAWVFGSASGALDPEILPAPWEVARTAGDLIAEGTLQSNLLTSLRRAAFGLVLGVSIGLVLALISGLSRLGEAVVDGPVQIKRSIPTLALIPLFIVWFGIGEEMKLIVITASVLVPVYINTHAQLRGVDARYVELAQTVGLSRWGFIRRVALPGSLPGFFTGLRLAVTISWLALVVVEQVNATSGIGYLMTQARTYGQIDVIVVGLVIYGLLGLFGDLAVRALERKALAWRQTLAD